MRCTLCINRTPWSKRNRSDRYFWYPSVSEPAGTVSDRDGDRSRSCLCGIIYPAEISDATFAEEILGTTVAVEPEAAELVAPCDGTILSIYDTGHAVCMTTPSGGELLIHAGIDTVKMEGRGFTKCVADGDYVHAGDVLLKMDLDAIRKEGYETTTMMILTNADDYDVEKVSADHVSCGEKMMVLHKKYEEIEI